LIEHHEVARVLEQELLHANINCLTANETAVFFDLKGLSPEM